MSEGAIERLTQVIWELEAELGLLEWETHGVRLWEAARMPAYYAIAHQLGVLDTPTVMLPPGIAPRVRVAAELAAAGALKNPFVPAGKVDALVFESGRAYEVDGDWVCPYSFALTRELRAQGRKPLLLERRARGQKEKTSDPARRKLEALELARAVAGRVQAPRLARDPALRGMAERIDAALQLRYPGQRVTTLKTLSETLVRFQIDLALYRGLLALHRPREVYCVVAYAGFAPLMAAARERRIRSIELQHGVISHFHLGYSFPERDFATLRYFPDVVYTWGEPWDTLMDVPLPAERRQAYGFKYFEHRAQPYRHAEKSPRRLLVISQGTIGRELAEVVLRSAPALAHCEIKYKLHPSEAQRWKEYPALVELAKRPNVEIVLEGNLYELMSTCAWQVGVYSTALYEGQALGLQTALVNLPGIEYMKRWFERGAAVRFEELPARLPPR